MQPIRVLLVSLLPILHRGGQVNVVRLLEGLPASDYRLTVAAPEAGPLLDFARARGAGAEVLRVPRLKGSPKRTLLYQPWKWLGVRDCRRVIQRTADIVYVDPEVFVPALSLAKEGTDAKLVWHAQTAFRSPMDRHAMQLADRVVTVSRAVDERLAPHGHAEKRTNIGNAVDTERFRPGMARSMRDVERVASDESVFVYVGSLEHLKGCFELVDAFARIAPETRSRLWMIGTGRPEAEKALRARTNELGIDQRVKFWGKRSDIEALLAASDVFVLPSHAEGLSLSLLEAMAGGLACIGSDAPGVAEPLEGAGVIVPVQNAAALARAMQELSASGEMRARFGSLARARVERHYTIDSFVKSFDALFRDIRNEAP